jgi:hypothetical protein
MELLKNDYKLLCSYIGYGVIKEPHICFFGNESGTGGMHTTDYIPKFLKDLQKTIHIKSAAILPEINDLPVSSVFLQFIARLLLAIEQNEIMWFETLSSYDKIDVVSLNYYIINRFNKENTCVFNLRPLPRPTERVWPYSSVNEKDYIKSYNFCLKRPLTNEFKQIRIQALYDGFEQIKDTLIIGIGDKENKRKFFEQLYQCSFKKIYDFYYDEKHNIILSNYFDNKNGIGLNGLKHLYNFIIGNSII